MRLLGLSVSSPFFSFFDLREIAKALHLEKQRFLPRCRSFLAARQTASVYRGARSAPPSLWIPLVQLLRLPTLPRRSFGIFRGLRLRHQQNKQIDKTTKKRRGVVLIRGRYVARGNHAIMVTSVAVGGSTASIKLKPSTGAPDHPHLSFLSPRLLSQ